MRVGNFNSQRPQYYDRNASFVSANTSAQSAGAGSFIQNTSFYTVPAGKKLFLSQLTVTMFNVTSFTAGDYGQVIFNCLVGGVTTSLFGRVTYYFSKFNEAYNISLPSGAVLNATDVLRAQMSGSGSGVSNVTVSIYMGGTLFDA